MLESVFLIPWYLLLPIFVTIIFVLLSCTLAKIRDLTESRRLTKTTIVTLYKPPASLSPSELGYLVDYRFGRREIIADAISLEQQGYITIDSAGAISPTGRQLDDADTSSYDYLLSRVRTGAITTIRSISGTQLKEYRRYVKESLRRRDLIGTKLMPGFVTRTFRFSIIPFAVIAIAACYVLLATESADSSSAVEIISNLLPVVALISFLLAPITYTWGVILAVLHWLTNGYQLRGTAELSRLWPEIVGYRRYIRQAQRDRIRYETEQLKRKSKEIDYPYLIAFGLARHKNL